jgi:uncharacterized cofD-like protein
VATLNSSGQEHRPSPIRRVLLFLQPGIGLKRWAGLAVIGLLLLVLGLVFALSTSPGETFLRIGRTVTLSSVIPALWRGVIFAGSGGAIAGFALFRLYNAVLFGASYTTGGRGVIENLSMYRLRRGGPKIVAIGGGTGLASLLRGLKHYTEEITAVVTVADDGGSSGMLRNELGMAPPGDARQCLIALSESEPLMEEVLSYRFNSGDSLQGHSMGNLLLAALTETRGSFHNALQAAAKLLTVKGQVVPASISPVVLVAETASGHILSGESAIGLASERLTKLWVESSVCEVNPAAAAAIVEADAIVIGPGSLYTSVIPNFLVPGLAEVVRRSGSCKIFVCNVATQPGETDGMSASEHLEIFQQHAQVSATHLLLNDAHLPIDLESGQEPISAQPPAEFSGCLVLADLIDGRMPTRHDPQKLALAVIECVRKFQTDSSSLVRRLNPFSGKGSSRVS